MNNIALKTLLKEYDNKRIKAETDLQERKEKLLSSNKRLQDIEYKLNSYAFKEVQNILKTSSSADKFKDEILKLKNEKNEILENLNLPQDYLLPNYECTVCKDTGYVTENYSSTMCKCLKQKLFDIEYNKSNIGNLDKENFSTFDENKFSNTPNQEKYNSSISPRQNILNIKKLCASFIENFDDENEKNLLFTGNTGLGKTFLSNCIAKELLSKGKTVLYQTSSVMLDTIIDYRFGKQNAPKDIYENILNVDLLIVDDLGTETMNSLKFTELFNIINTRLLNQNNHITKTIISTNLNLQNLFSAYDERIVSRLVGYYNICRFFGDDLRFKK